MLWIKREPTYAINRGEHTAAKSKMIQFVIEKKFVIKIKT